MRKTLTSFGLLILLASVPEVLAQRRQGVTTTLLAELKTQAVNGASLEVKNLGDATFIRSGGHVYKATYRGGRMTRPTPLPSLVGLDEKILSIGTFDNALWVTKFGVDPVTDGSAYRAALRPFLAPLILVSRDQGSTFKAFDSTPFQRTLQTDFGAFTEFAVITQLEQHTIGGRKALVANAGAGASAWVHFGPGTAWKPMIPGTEEWGSACYDGYFEIAGNKMFFGGECPLDSAYLQSGTISRAGTIARTARPRAPELENRRLQFIRKSPYNAQLLFAGTEGGLLVSRDGGTSWTFSFIERESDTQRGSRHYPYIRNIVFPDSRNPNRVVVAGQPQSGLGTVLVSNDAGRTWTDISSDAVGENECLGLGQLPDGKLYVGVRKPTTDGMTFAEKAELRLLSL